MKELIESIGRHGYLLLFTWVLAEQIGLPIPALPVLLAAGVLSGMGKLSFPMCVALALMACLIGDALWFALGRRYGGRVIHLLCRISFEPDTCVRKSSGFFQKHGPAALLLAKFVPGIGGISIPMAGNSPISLGTFALYDFAGCSLYVLATTSVGLLFSGSVERIQAASQYAGRFGLVFVLGGTAVLAGLRFRQRKRFLRDVRMSRITADGLNAMLQNGERPYIVDLRHPLDFLPNPQLIPTALRISSDELLLRAAEIPRDRDIILYCT